MQVGVRKTPPVLRGHTMSFLGRLAVVGALFCALAGPASAAPCWKSVVLDWAADGSVDRTYPIACYHQAITHLQPDLQLYSSASDDIRRALQRVVTANSEPTTVVVAATDKGDSVPRPLVILGGVAILLVAAGLAGMIWRRSQGDRPGTDSSDARGGAEPQCSAMGLRGRRDRAAQAPAARPGSVRGPCVPPPRRTPGCGPAGFETYD